MQKNETRIFGFVLLVFILFTGNIRAHEISDSTLICEIEEWKSDANRIYQELGDSSLSYVAFQEGYQGYLVLKNQGKLTNEKYLTIVDFSKESSEDRLYIIDMESFCLETRTLCAHGKNTGRSTARKFSNTSGSLQSSLGFYVTQETYSGKFDLALKLRGLEYSNSKARSRGVVMHGANYATYDFLERNGMLGRSFGCPAIPMDQAEEIIHKVKAGACLYIYHPNASYHRHSRILRDYDFLIQDDFAEN